MASLVMNTPARNDTAMTGEITLTGPRAAHRRRERKVLAARRAGITRVILSKGNQKHLRELPDEVRREMDFVFADRVGDVLRNAVPGYAGQLHRYTA